MARNTGAQIATLSSGGQIFYLGSPADANGNAVSATEDWVYSPTSNLYVPRPIDQQNLPMGSVMGAAPSFTANTGAISSTNTATTLAMTLGSLSYGNGVFDARQATIRILNTSNQPITGLTLTLQDSVGGTEIPITYNITGLSIAATNGTYTWVLPLTLGIALNASLSAGYGAAPTGGEVYATATFQGAGGVLSQFTGSNATEGNYSLTWAAGLANATTAPTLSTATTGGSLAGATYYVEYTWENDNGETLASAEASIVIPTTTTTNTLTATLPAFPSGATKANVYIATTSGSETLQGSTTTTTYTQTAALVSGAALPTANTTGQPANTEETVSIPLPASLQSDALYLVSINNPTALGTSVTVNLQNAINFGAGNAWSNVTSVDVASGATKSYLVQGWLLGDGAAQISATNDAVASASGGTVQVQVRKV